MVVCRLGPALSSFPPPLHPTSPRLWWVILNPNRLLSHRPHHTVARLQPPGARRGLRAGCSISNGARGGWSCRARQGWGLGGDWSEILTGLGQPGCATPPHPAPFPITKPQPSHSAPAQSCKCTHCCVCTHVC